MRLLGLAVLALLAACSSTPEPGTLRNFAAPLPGIFTSGQPTELQFASLSRIGITRVIQLRLADETGTGWEEERAEEVGIAFVRIPVAGSKGLTRANVDRLREELDRPNDAGTLVCCGSSNRVGALLALKAFLDGAGSMRALEIGRAAGLTRLEPAERELLQ